MADVMRKALTINKLHLGRLKNQMSELIKIAMNIENLSKLEALLMEYRAIKKEFDQQTNKILIELDDSDSVQKKTMEGLFKDSANVSDTLATFEGKVKSFHRILEGEANRESLVPPGLNQSFRSTSTIQPKVKRIEVPSFDGDILKFNSFRGLFENLVHNNSDLSNVQKLYYLKQALIEGAADLIRDFELTDNSYAQAWEIVIERYENKRLVVKTLFKKLTLIEEIKSDVKIRSLLDQFDVIIRALKANGECIDNTFSKFLTFMIVSRLDFRTAKEFENSIGASESYPEYEKIQKFLANRALTAEEFVSTNNKKPSSSSKTSSAEIKPSSASTSSVLSNKPKEKRSFTTTVSKTLKCVVCSQPHYLNQCDQFLNKSNEDRFNIIKHNRLCVRCFNPFHRVAECTRPKCSICDGNHHKLLHREQLKAESSQSSNLNVADRASDKVSLSVISSDNVNNKTVLLPTAIVSVRIMTKAGQQLKPARVLFDNGSQVTLVSEAFIRNNRVNVLKSQVTSKIGGITGDSMSTEFYVNFALVSRYNSFKLDIQAEVVGEIPYSVETSLISETIKLNSSLKFAETETTSNNVDIVIGAEYCEKCMLGRREYSGSIFLRDSEFGWVISGPYIVNKQNPNSFCGVTVLNVQEQLKKFWEIEEVDIAQTKKLELEHQQCQEFVSKNLERDETGRFVTKLPLKIEREKLGESKPKAVAALKRIETKYDSDLRQKYIAVMDEYLQLGHMEEMKSSTDEPTYFIPHRAVVKPTSTTTKVRVVFNASCPTSTGISLNDALMVGPTIQPELIEVLICFRKHSIAFSCDVTKMYRQIQIHPSDRDLQRIVWRSNVSMPIGEYRLNTLTFGTAPASYIATKCLEVLSDSIAVKHPEASRAIRQDFVMDDLLTGAPTVANAVLLQRTINETLASAHFPLRKYMSNSNEFLAQLDPSIVEKISTFDFGQKNAISLLGLYWQPNNDSLAIKLQLRENTSIFNSLTKRLLLSEIARIYDPIGAIAPVTIRAKIFLQDVWNENRNWDDIVSNKIINSFKTYYEELPLLSTFSLRRRYCLFDNIAETQLIGFCDASERAYAAVVYLRSVDKFGNVDSYFVASKTKVAPRNEFKLTIPKLELQAAELLSRLLKRLTDVLNVNSFFAFSDSSVVLSWLNGDINRWTLFVQNRVCKIVSVVESSKWSYVKSKSNPADLATRGISVHNLINNELWVKGPEFLRLNSNLVLENDKIKLVNYETLPEQRKIVLTIVNVEKESHLFNLIEKHSNFIRLLNAFRYVLKFINSQISNFVKCNDVTDFSQCALTCMIRIVQCNSYGKEISALAKGKPISKSSSLFGLDLFLDSQNVLRNRSRLDNSLLSYKFRNLIVIPAKCHFFKMFVMHIHERFFHASKSFVLNYIKSMYLVRGGIVNIVKRVLYDCIQCKRFAAKTMSQKMGQLPAVRVVPDRPFNNVGVDLAGPLSVKCVGHRTTKFGKIYAAIFVCMCTKAVHIEVLSSLSTKAFVATLDRFVARRGVPSRIYSDNATNFVGCSSLLKSIHENNYKWSFIPPRTPHQGGLWEAAVKSAKTHLVNVTHGQTLDFEEYSTVFASIEAILNSRPLCLNSGQVLTPGHFLTGSNLLMPSTIPEEIQPKTLGQRFKLQQNVINSFWNVWSKDYLNQLRNSNKWRNAERNLHPGDVVLVKEDNSSVCNWPMGIIEKVYPDKDQLVRNVDVKVNGSIKRRNVSSLVFLISGHAPHPHPGE